MLAYVGAAHLGPKPKLVIAINFPPHMHQYNVPTAKLYQPTTHSQTISEQKDILLRNWGACVDTVFRHVLR